MPELPEVETTVNGLKKKVLKRTFLDIWTDSPKLIKKISFQDFKKKIIKRKIIAVKRRAKNILFFLDQDYVLLVHLKMTGHLLIGKWKNENKKWISQKIGSLSIDPFNRFLHLIFFLDNGSQIALSDLRKFAKIELWNKKELLGSKEYLAIGPEPLDPGLTFKKFKNLFCFKKGKIKQVLMDQSFIAGIGNIYANEILFFAKIHPETKTEKLTQDNLKKIYQAIKKVLKTGIKQGGSSISDYRNIFGEKGNYQKKLKVYGRSGKKCLVCGETIKKITISTRSTFFCPKCQTKK